MTDLSNRYRKAPASPRYTPSYTPRNRPIIPEPKPIKTEAVAQKKVSTTTISTPAEIPSKKPPLDRTKTFKKRKNKDNSPVWQSRLSMSPKRIKTIKVAGLVLAGVLIGLLAAIHYKKQTVTPKPTTAVSIANVVPGSSEYKQTIAYSAYFPNKNSPLDLKNDTVAVDSELKQLNYRATLKDDPKTILVVSQQQLPANFTASKLGIDNMLGSMGGNQGSFESSNGSVYLTRVSTEANSDPLAILVSKGTLIIARSSKALSKEVWKNIFDHLEIR